jgi:molybdopterin converting factor small subunit|tara:strand:- start:206 stop:472 length:267 start_codon:yes stop_codon:yes gene_type:complete
MEIQLKLYGSSKILSDKDTLNIQLPNNSNIKKLRDILTKIISEKHLKTNLKNLPKTAAFFSESDEVINDSYKLRNKEFISIIPPIGGG